MNKVIKTISLTLTDYMHIPSANNIFLEHLYCILYDTVIVSIL